MNRIKQARLVSGFTQKELSIKSGVSRSCIARLEITDTYPTIKTAVKLAKALKCSAFDLIEVK